MFKVNNKDTKILSLEPLFNKVVGLYIKKIAQQRRSGVFIVNFTHISHLVLVFL